MVQLCWVCISKTKLLGSTLELVELSRPVTLTKEKRDSHCAIVDTVNLTRKGVLLGLASSLDHPLTKNDDPLESASVCKVPKKRLTDNKWLLLSFLSLPSTVPQQALHASIQMIPNILAKLG